MGSLVDMRQGASRYPEPTDSERSLAEIARLLEHAQSALHEDSQASYLCLEQAMELLRRANLCATCTVRAPGGLSAWQTRRLDAYIQQNLETSIRTNQLAALLNLSSSHFSHAFKQSFGTTPLNYVARKRIEAARQMMLSSDAPLTHIAHAHGFCDQSHFSRTFRRETGVSPQLWRQRRGEWENQAPKV